MKKYTKYKNTGIDWIGEIPEEWKCVPLKSIFQIVSGATPDSNKIEFWEGDIPWVTPADYKTPDHFVGIGRKSLTKEGYDSCSTTLVPEGSIIFSKRAPIGSVAIAQSELCTNQGCLSCVPGDKSNSRFYYYVMSSLTETFNMLGTGTTFKEISAKAFGDVMVQCPSIDEQNAIANYLDYKVGQIAESVSAIDAQIEDLKSYRQSLISETVTKGLNPNAKMKNSGVDWIGEIPEEWNIVPLKHYLSLKGRIGWNGLKSEEFQASAYAYLVTGQDFRSDVVDWSKCYQINKERYDEDPFIQLSNGDLLVTKDGTIGKVAKVVNLDKPACLNSGIFVVKQTSDIFVQNYLYWLFVSNQLKEFVGYNSTGSTIQHLYQNVFENMPLIVPTLSEQQAIADYLDKKTAKIDAAIEALNAQKTDLEALKQSLISEAVTGKVDVRGWKPNKEQ